MGIDSNEGGSMLLTQRSLGSAGCGTAEATTFVEEGSADSRLSRREAQILRILRMGLTNKQIACAVFVTEDTVKFHLKNIYRKLGARGRMEAVHKTAREASLG